MYTRKLLNCGILKLYYEYQNGTFYGVYTSYETQYIYQEINWSKLFTYNFVNIKPFQCVGKFKNIKQNALW